MLYTVLIPLCDIGLQLIPIGAVQALVNVSLLKKIPPFKQLLKVNFTNAIIVSILPGVLAPKLWLPLSSGLVTMV